MRQIFRTAFIILVDLIPRQWEVWKPLQKIQTVFKVSFKKRFYVYTVHKASAYCIFETLFLRGSYYYTVSCIIIPRSLRAVDSYRFIITSAFNLFFVDTWQLRYAANWLSRVSSKVLNGCGLSGLEQNTPTRVFFTFSHFFSFVKEYFSLRLAGFRTLRYQVFVFLLQSATLFIFVCFFGHLVCLCQSH